MIRFPFVLIATISIYIAALSVNADTKPIVSASTTLTTEHRSPIPDKRVEELMPHVLHQSAVLAQQERIVKESKRDAQFHRRVINASSFGFSVSSTDSGQGETGFTNDPTFTYRIRLFDLFSSPDKRQENQLQHEEIIRNLRLELMALLIQYDEVLSVHRLAEQKLKTASKNLEAKQAKLIKGEITEVEISALRDEHVQAQHQQLLAANKVNLAVHKIVTLSGLPLEKVKSVGSE